MINRSAGGVYVALRISVTLFPTIHVHSRMKKPRTKRGQSLLWRKGHREERVPTVMLPRLCRPVDGHQARRRPVALAGQLLPTLDQLQPDLVRRRRRGIERPSRSCLPPLDDVAERGGEDAWKLKCSDLYVAAPLGGPGQDSLAVLWIPPGQ